MKNMVSYKKSRKLHGIWTIAALVCLGATFFPLGLLPVRLLNGAAVVCIFFCIYTGHKMLKKDKKK